MTSPRLKRRLIALALASVVLAAAVFFTRPWWTPFRLVIVETRAEPATPAMQSQGYDTRVLVLVKAYGRRPQQLTNFSILSSKLGSHSQLIAATGRLSSGSRAFATWQKELDAWEVEYNLKLRKLAAGKVILRDQVALDLGPVAGADGQFDYSVQPNVAGQTLAIDAIARTSGTTEFKPVRNIQIKVVSVSSGPAQIDRQFDQFSKTPVHARAHLELAGQGTPKRPYWSLRGFDLVDAKGRRLNQIANPRKGEPYPLTPLCWANPDSREPASRTRGVDIFVSWAGAKPGPLWIRGKVYLHPFWPVVIHIPIRDAQGKAIALKSTSPDEAPGVKVEAVELPRN